MADELVIRIFDVEHGACAILQGPSGKIAMIDCGHNETTSWRPSTFIRNQLARTTLDYLFVTNADHDHLSDLNGLRATGVHVEVLVRNGSPSEPALRILKEAGGDLTNDVECFLQMHAGYNGYAIPFNDAMGGVTCSTFCNLFPAFTDTNNLSMATFIKYGGFKMLFPGDLEGAGWKALLQNPAFVAELKYTDVLVASHHGRENGYCEEIFEHFTPQVVVISDKPIAHETQKMVPDYRAVVHPNGVVVTNQFRRRHVLTTRRDGDIFLQIGSNGTFRITTEKDWQSLRAA